MKPVRTWIIVADSARARIFENTGPGKGISELEEHALEVELKPSGDIDADRPGRSFDSAGQGRHAMEPTTDANRQAKKQIVGEIAALLEKSYQRKSYDRLVLVAPPATLGDLRQGLGKTLSGVVYGELAKDLTKLAKDDIVGHLEEILAT